MEIKSGVCQQKLNLLSTIHVDSNASCNLFKPGRSLSRSYLTGNKLKIPDRVVILDVQGKIQVCGYPRLLWSPNTLCAHPQMWLAIFGLCTSSIYVVKFGEQKAKRLPAR